MAIDVLRRGEPDFTRRYWWVLLLLVFAVGGVAWLVTGPGGRGLGGGASGPSGAAQDQSLGSIDDALRSAGAPGAPVDLSMEGAGAYRRHDDSAGAQRSSLFERSSTALNIGSPLGVGSASRARAGAGSASVGSSSLANALRNVANAKPGPSKGWGDEKARTGFTPGKANFGSFSGLGGGGGGSGAGSSGGGSAGTPFGIAGANPTSAGTIGGDAAGGRKIRKGARNQAFDMLKQVQQTANASTRMGVEGASNLNASGFDGGSKSNAGVAGAGGAGTGDGSVGEGDGVAGNLKLDDPKLQKKNIDVPVVPPSKDAETMDMSKMIMMMVVQMAIAGILGPVFGGIGAGIAGAMTGTTQPMPTYNINSNFGQTPTTTH